MLINVKMPTIVGILTFMSRINFLLSRVEHEKSFITLGLVTILSWPVRNIIISLLYMCILVCLFDLILYAQSTIFQFRRDGSSWIEPVLS